MRVKAGLTVFLALLIGMMIAVVFGFLEAARVSGLKSNAEMQTMQASDSLLSEYQPGLWEDYDVLLWDASEGGADGAALRQKQYLDQNRSFTERKRMRLEYPFLEINANRVVVDAYEYVTDRGGEPFREQAVLAAKEGLAETAVTELADALAQKEGDSVEEETIERMEEEAGELDQKLESGAEHEEEGSDETEEMEASETGITESLSLQQKHALKKDNPIKWMIRMKKEGILAVVMQDKSISEKEMKQVDKLEKRSLQAGNYIHENPEGSADELWYLLYLQQHFSDASREGMGGVFDYELEYLIAGKLKDADNLKSVVNRLLLMREGVNYVYLLHDAGKSNEALLLATAIASAFGQPELAEPVKHAILLAWAYAESISDVRVLLDGGKLLPVKTKAQWRTELSNLAGTYCGEEGKPENSKGLTYTQYLQLLLLMEKKDKVTYRTMDLIEQREEIRMDQMISRMKCSYLFEAPPLFWRFVTIGDNTFSGFTYQTNRTVSYFPGEQN